MERTLFLSQIPRKIMVTRWIRQKNQTFYPQNCLFEQYIHRTLPKYAYGSNRGINSNIYTFNIFETSRRFSFHYRFLIQKKQFLLHKILAESQGAAQSISMVLTCVEYRACASRFSRVFPEKGRTHSKGNVAKWWPIVCIKLVVHKRVSSRRSSLLAQLNVMQSRSRHRTLVWTWIFEELIVISWCDCIFMSAFEWMIWLFFSFGFWNVGHFQWKWTKRTLEFSKFSFSDRSIDRSRLLLFNFGNQCLMRLSITCLCHCLYNCWLM